MTSAKVISRSLLALFVIGIAASMLCDGHAAAPAQQATLDELVAKVQKQYAAIQDLFLHGPAKKVFPPDPHQRLHQWQDDLARSFAQAGETIDAILKLEPPDAEKWRERRERMWLYSQPVSPPRKAHGIWLRRSSKEGSLDRRAPRRLPK